MTYDCPRCVIIKQSLQKNTAFTAFVIITIGLMDEEFLNDLLMKFWPLETPISLSAFAGPMKTGLEHGAVAHKISSWNKITTMKMI